MRSFLRRLTQNLMARTDTSSPLRSLARCLAPVLLVSAGCGRPPAAVEAPPRISVQAVAVRADQVTHELMAVGTIVPVDRSRVAAAAEGKVIQFPHRIGDYVQEGELLAELRTVTLAIELEGAKALLRLRA